MIKVFCVDIGYSLRTECRKWEEDAALYPGQALYGVNHFHKFSVEPIFEWCEHGYFFGKWYAAFDEVIKLISLIKYRKDYELIYIPHAYYSRWLVVLKKLKLIKKPIVVCMHNKNNLRGLIKACDFVITINPNLEHKLIQQYKQTKVKYIPLLPERGIASEGGGEVKYDIISIGNTYRDYQVLIDAVRGLPYSCLIVTSQLIGDIPENVTIINDKLEYAKCLELYMQALVIAIPIIPKAMDGVFGLTSLIDALYVEKPVIVTKTKGMGIPIEQYCLGVEVEVGSVSSMREAVCQLMMNEENRVTISKNMKKFKRENNMERSSKDICKIFGEILGK